MPGYSGTPLARKLGIKTGHRVAILDAEDGFDRQLAGLPDGVEILDRLSGRKLFDVILLFAPSRRALVGSLEKAIGRMSESGGLWIAWPKKASGRETDLTEADVRAAGLARGLVDNKVCAITEIWSGLRFVVPLARRSDASSRK